MTARIEWMGEEHTTVQVVPKGTVIGEDTVTAECAVVFSADSITVVEGNYDRMTLLLGIALDQVQHLKRTPRVGVPTPSGE